MSAKKESKASKSPKKTESSSSNEKLTTVFQKIRQYFDGMDTVREKILPLQRKVVRTCSEIIKNIHRGEFENIVTKIEETKKDLAEMEHNLVQSPGEFQTDYMEIAQQEFGEAFLFYYIILTEEIKTPEEVGIGYLGYTYALSDVVGELRRYVMNCLRDEDLEKAQKGFQFMDEIYGQLFTLDYPKGLMPGLRNKIDQARGILAKTEGDLVVTANILKLNRNLERNLNLTGKKE